MNEIVEKKIHAVETPVNNILFSKTSNSCVCIYGLYCTKWAKHKMEGNFLKLENIV